MIDLLAAGNNKKKVSVKYLIITFFVCISIVAWLGISDLRADVDDPGDNTDEMNKTQTLRIENLAKEAASQDPDVNDENYDDKVDTYTQQIEDWRSDGMGWGDIVHNLNRDYDLNIHPSVLGLGHSKKSSEEAAQSSKKSSMQSGNTQGQGLALGHSKDNSSNRGGGNGGGNGGGKGGGKK